jgi:hypothetical protein
LVWAADLRQHEGNVGEGSSPCKGKKFLICF